MTRKLLTGVIAIVLLLAFGSDAFAKRRPRSSGGDELMQKKVLNFEDEMIEGNLLRPTGVEIDAIGGSKGKSLIRIRKNFVPEILKSAEDV